MRPYLRVANVYDARLDLSDVMEMNFTPEEYETFRLEPGDVLLNEGQSLEWVGRAAIYRGVPKGACFQNTLVRFRAGPRVLSEFALLVFRHYVYGQRFRRIARWTTNIAHLGADRFSEIEFPVPPLLEQERIVACTDEQFTRLEAGVQSLHRLETHLRRYRAAVLKAACDGTLLHSARGAAPAGESAHEFLARVAEAQLASGNPKNRVAPPPEPNLPNLPAGWAWSTLEHLSSRIRNGISVKPDQAAGMPILRISSVRPMRVDTADVRYLPDMNGAEAEYLLNEGDLLFTRYNGTYDLVGVCGRVPALSHPLVHPDKLIRVRPLDSDLGGYIEIAANGGVSRQFIESRIRTTAGQAGISGADLKATPIPIPPPSERRRIVAEVHKRLSQADAIEQATTVDLARAARLRASILRSAFEGSLVVADRPSRASVG
jgi:type I restriction enzyme S subunit